MNKETYKKEFSQWVNPTGQALPAALAAGKTDNIILNDRDIIKANGCRGIQ
ncbi:MAG: hypothetical protein IJ520_00190 [Synergistaceae bacterium]|nr:hypothetical protein [Synergistaceae bacterium]MBQ8691548.1 hypothetical protein [Synergistaceae bacterium]